MASPQAPNIPISPANSNLFCTYSSTACTTQMNQFYQSPNLLSCHRLQAMMATFSSRQLKHISQQYAPFMLRLIFSCPPPNLCLSNSLSRVSSAMMASTVGSQCNQSLYLSSLLSTWCHSRPYSNLCCMLPCLLQSAVQQRVHGWQRRQILIQPYSLLTVYPVLPQLQLCHACLPHCF